MFILFSGLFQTTNDRPSAHPFFRTASNILLLLANPLTLFTEYAPTIQRLKLPKGAPSTSYLSHNKATRLFSESQLYRKAKRLLANSDVCRLNDKHSFAKLENKISCTLKKPQDTQKWLNRNVVEYAKGFRNRPSLWALENRGRSLLTGTNPFFL